VISKLRPRQQTNHPRLGLPTTHANHETRLLLCDAYPQVGVGYHLAKSHADTAHRLVFERAPATNRDLVTLSSKHLEKELRHL
jgi:hypothetical protein